MTYIELHQEVFTHRKSLALAQLLRAKSYAIVGHLSALWCWALDNVPSDGSLEGISDEVLTQAAGWSGRASFPEALRQVGFISENNCLRNWDLYGGKLQDRRETDRGRKRDERRISKGLPADVPKKSEASRAGEEKPSVAPRSPEKPSVAQPGSAKAPPAERARVLAFQLYEQTIGTIDAHLAQKVQEALDDDWTEECQTHCFAEASEHNARNWKYVDAIRKRHKAEGCFAGAPTNGTMPPTDPEAEWLAERYRRGKAKQPDAEITERQAAHAAKAAQ
jgi:hypothetical protein